MNTSIQILDSITSVIIFLAAIPSLWISGRIILRNSMAEDRLTRLFLWFALGGLFLIPLIDLIAYLRDFISLATPSNQDVAYVPLFLGTISWPLYSVIVISMGIISYAFAIYCGQKLITAQQLPFVKALKLGSLERGFLVLGLAGLFNQMIKGIIINFIWMTTPVPTDFASRGLIGSLVGLIIAFLVFAIIVNFMNRHLGIDSDEE